MLVRYEGFGFGNSVSWAMQCTADCQLPTAVRAGSGIAHSSFDCINLSLSLSLTHTHTHTNTHKHTFTHTHNLSKRKDLALETTSAMAPSGGSKSLAMVSLFRRGITCNSAANCIML